MVYNDSDRNFNEYIENNVSISDLTNVNIAKYINGKCEKNGKILKCCNNNFDCD